MKINVTESREIDILFLFLISLKYNLVFLLKKVLRTGGVSIPFGLSYRVKVVLVF